MPSEELEVEPDKAGRLALDDTLRGTAEGPKGTVDAGAEIHGHDDDLAAGAPMTDAKAHIVDPRRLDDPRRNAADKARLEARIFGGDVPQVIAETQRTGRYAILGPLGEGGMGLVHRDFKPSNAIVDGEGRPRVLDFGLARKGEGPASHRGFGEEVVDIRERAARGLTPSAVRGQDHARLSLTDGRGPDATTPPLDMALTATGTVLGTPAYMPLEQMQGFEADERSDQFSSCVSLWEAVYGERPFEGSSIGELLANMEGNTIREPPRGTSVPVRLRQILTRGLASDPNARWPSMDELLQHLDALVAPRSRRFVVLGLTMFTVAAIVAALGLLPLPRGDGEPFPLYSFEPGSHEARWSPDGTRILTAWKDTARIENADGTAEPLVLRGHEGGVHSVRWSPDGTRILRSTSARTKPPPSPRMSNRSVLGAGPSPGRREAETSKPRRWPPAWRPPMSRSTPTLRVPRWCPLLALALGPIACSPGVSLDDAVDETELQDLCGSTPTQVLALDPAETVPFDPRAIVPYRNGWLMVIAHLSEPFDGTLSPESYTGSSWVVSVDACGESSELITMGVDRLFPPLDPRLPWHACSSVTEELVTFDPDGRLNENRLGTVEGCYFREIEGRIWVPSQRDDGSDVLFMEQPVEPGIWSLTQIAEDLLRGPRSYDVDGDTLWYVNANHELVQFVVAPMFELSIIAPDVGAVRVAGEGRFLVWGTESEPFTPGRWTLYDRETDQTTAIEVAGRDDVDLHQHRGSSLLFESSVDGADTSWTWIRLPNLETTTFVGDFGEVLEVGEDLFLKSADGTSIHRLRDGATGPELLYQAVRAAGMDVDGDRLLVWDFYDVSAGIERESATKLVGIPLDGGEPEVVVDDVYLPLGLDDGRWLAVGDYAPRGRGTLRVLDPDGTEHEIDEDVSPYSMLLDGPIDSASGWAAHSASEPLLYRVHYDGHRNGIWRVGLAPLED